VFALSLVEHSTDDAVMHVEDLIGDSRLSIEQYCNERGIASPALQFSQMLSAHLFTFASELSKTILMDRLAELSGEIYLENSMQPIGMRKQALALGSPGGCRSQVITTVRRPSRGKSRASSLLRQSSSSA
jgi:hypothetical protein